jgi:putative glutamine amidotransferase
MGEPTRKVQPEEVMPEGMSGLPADAPTVAVVVSLNFPDMTEEINEIVIRFTKTALQSLTQAGARVILVDSSASPLPAPHLIHEADGALFLGGGDVDPALYGLSGPVRNLYGVDRAADDYCIDVIRASIEQDDPVLAICRGSQLLNYALGGTLIPDLESWALHRGGPGKPLFLDEEVTLTKGTKLHRILQRDRLTVRSGHHQAVGTVAPSLRVAALADDGIVEAIEHTEASWVIGVQWHPEDTEANAEDRFKLIGAFVDHVDATRTARQLIQR